MPPDPRKTRQRILEAFAELYGPEGSADIEAIAIAAGVSRSTVYRHFTHAGEMLAAAREQGLAAGARLVELHLASALRGDPDADLLTDVARLVEGILVEGIPFSRLLRLDAGADATIREHYERFAVELVRKAQRDGDIAADLAPFALYVACVSLCRGLIAAVEEGVLEPVDAAGVSTRFFASLRPR